MATIHEFTKSVSIVTAGEQDARWFSAQYPGYEVVDLRRFLKKNPAESVAHKVDYHDAHTLMVVVGQDGYPDVMLHLIDRMEKGVDKLLIHCTSGWHRASVVGKTIESMANTIMHDGIRAFNVQTFCLHNCVNERMYSSTARNAEGWQRAPWELMPAPTLEGIVGYAACKQSQASSVNWNYV